MDSVGHGTFPTIKIRRPWEWMKLLQFGCPYNSMGQIMDGENQKMMTNIFSPLLFYGALKPEFPGESKSEVLGEAST